MKKKEKRHIETALVADAPAPDMYAIRTIAVRFREIHRNQPDYTRERLKTDVLTALLGDGHADVADALIEEAIGI
jgi:hypothetical protein